MSSENRDVVIEKLELNSRVANSYKYDLSLTLNDLSGQNHQSQYNVRNDELVDKVLTSQVPMLTRSGDMTLTTSVDFNTYSKSDYLSVQIDDGYPVNQAEPSLRESARVAIVGTEFPPPRIVDNASSSESTEYEVEVLIANFTLTRIASATGKYMLTAVSKKTNKALNVTTAMNMLIEGSPQKVIVFEESESPESLEIDFSAEGEWSQYFDMGIPFFIGQVRDGEITSNKKQGVILIRL